MDEKLKVLTDRYEKARQSYFKIEKRREHQENFPQASELHPAELRDKYDELSEIAISQLDGTVEKLWEHAVTKLKNKNAFNQRIATETEDDLKRETFVVAVDINDLKTANDHTKSHTVGDAYLFTFGEAINASIRPTDEAYHTGGDEFVFIIRSPDIKTVDEIMQRTLENFKTMWAEKQPALSQEIGIPLYIEASFAYGMASIAEKEIGRELRDAPLKDKIQKLMDIADKRQYQHKVQIKSSPAYLAYKKKQSEIHGTQYKLSTRQSETGGTIHSYTKEQ